jgi:hypothetical protein
VVAVKNSIVNKLTHEWVKELRALSNRFGSEWTGKKLETLQQAAACRIEEVKVLIDYHDCLLFLLAYPENAELYTITNSELQRTAAVAQSIFEDSSVRKQLQLTNSGLTGTKINVAFSFSMIEWLVNTYPAYLEIFECGADPVKVKEIVSVLLPVAERDSLGKKTGAIGKMDSKSKRQKCPYQPAMVD